MSKPLADLQCTLCSGMRRGAADLTTMAYASEARLRPPCLVVSTCGTAAGIEEGVGQLVCVSLAPLSSSKGA